MARCVGVGVGVGVFPMRNLLQPSSSLALIHSSRNLGQVDEVEALLPTLPHPTALEVARRMVTEGMVGCSPLCTQLGSIGARFLTSQDQQTVLEGKAACLPLCVPCCILISLSFPESPCVDSCLGLGVVLLHVVCEVCSSFRGTRAHLTAYAYSKTLTRTVGTEKMFPL